VTADIAVLGGGIIGHGILHSLADSANRIVWVCSETDRQYSATAASGAMLSTISEVSPLDDAAQSTLLAARLEGARMFDQWINSSDLDAGDVKRTYGTFVIGNRLARTDESTLRAISDRATVAGVATQRVPTSDIPGLCPEPVAGPFDAIYIPSEGSIDSAALLVRLGMAIRRRTNITIINDQAIRLALGDNGVSIRTRQQVFFAKQVVIACGAYSYSLLADSGLLEETGLPEIFGGRGVSVLLEPTIDLPHVIRTPNRAFACGLHLVPRCDGLLYLGATNRFSLSATQAPRPFVAELNDLLMQGSQQINYRIRAAVLRSHSVGFRPLTLDRIPLVGRTRHQSILVASGTYRNGVVMAPLISRVIAEELAQPGLHAGHAMSPIRIISTPYSKSRKEWLVAAAAAIVGALADAQHTSPLSSDSSLFAFVHTALACLASEEPLDSLRPRALRLLDRAPLEEALPSLVEIFARAARTKLDERSSATESAVTNESTR
jgi:glycine oxidase